MCIMKIGDLVKYVYNIDHTISQGVGVIIDTSKNSNEAPKDINGKETYLVRWCKKINPTSSGWYPPTCLEVIS